MIYKYKPEIHYISRIYIRSTAINTVFNAVLGDNTTRRLKSVFISMYIFVFDIRYYSYFIVNCLETVRSGLKCIRQYTIRSRSFKLIEKLRSDCFNPFRLFSQSEPDLNLDLAIRSTK